MAGKNFGSIAFLILFYVVLLNYQPTNSYNITTYNDSEAGIRVFNTLSYGDGTLVIYMVKSINETCIEPKLYIRVIYANGTIETSTQIYPIPEFNFCQIIKKDMYTIRIDRLQPNNALMVYMNSTDINSSSTYGMLLSKNGETISEFYMEKSTSYMGSFDGPHLYIEGAFGVGFLLFGLETNSNDFLWSHFSSPDKNGKISKTKTGKFPQAPIEKGDVILRFAYFPALNNGFGLVMANTTITEVNNNTKNTKPNQPPISIYASLIYPGEDDNNEVVGPFLIYQTADIDVTVKYLICSTSLTSSGYICIVRTEPLEFDQIQNFTDLSINNLFFGGFLLNINAPSETYENKYTTYGYILDNNLKINSTLDLPNNLTLPSFNQKLELPAVNRNYGIFTQNSTFIAIVPNENNNKNKGYGNPNIETTYPLINGMIEIASQEINVTYNTPIVPSINNISIYQINNNDQYILRQSFPADSSYCKISDDKKSLVIQVLTSTFNLPNTNYYVVVEDGALKLSSTGQPLIGICKNIWKFTTDNLAIKYADPANGILRLNVEGTNLFNNLNSTNKPEFIKNLKSELANLTPISPTRLNFIKDQTDYSTSPPTLLLSFEILKPNDNEDPQEINVSQAMDTLNTLIKNKFITVISSKNHTSFIDENYGFIFTRNLFEEYKIHLIIISVMIVIIIMLIWYSYKKYPEGNNIVILKLFLILIDFMLDIAFIFNNGKNVPQLFIPSNNYEFYEWFKKYANILAVFTVISSTEIDALLILSSKVAGLKPFSAPFSSNSLSLIFWCNLASFLIEDIPQFIIQIIYKNSIISYDLIPFLTLITKKSTVISIESIDDDEDSKIKDNINKVKIEDLKGVMANIMRE
ncbi:11284_t:CDS:10 [Entrophospora sp. SA101]|nr:11284_t:CDS:10 [Entrophospora sp. SA101]